MIFFFFLFPLIPFPHEMNRRPFAPGQKTGAIYLKFNKIQGKKVKNEYAPDDDFFLE